MVSKEMVIVNRSGLHVRPAGFLVKTAQPFDCNVTLKYDNKTYNVKSILGVMSAAIKVGTAVEFVCEGPQETVCMAAIEVAVAGGLGEKIADQ